MRREQKATADYINIIKRGIGLPSIFNQVICPTQVRCGGASSRAHGVDTAMLTRVHKHTMSRGMPNFPHIHRAHTALVMQEVYKLLRHSFGKVEVRLFMGGRWIINRA
jgi:hypothetical protein